MTVISISIVLPTGLTSRLSWWAPFDSLVVGTQAHFSTLSEEDSQKPDDTNFFAHSRPLVDSERACIGSRWRIARGLACGFIVIEMPVCHISGIDVRTSFVGSSASGLGEALRRCGSGRAARRGVPGWYGTRSSLGRGGPALRRCRRAGQSALTPLNGPGPRTLCPCQYRKVGYHIVEVGLPGCSRDAAHSRDSRSAGSR
jgi:hypothetical protein